MKLEDLSNIIIRRKNELPKRSYVASLIKRGENAILQKIGEEATEVIIASKVKNKKNIISEIADLYFMTLVLMASKNIKLEEIYRELEKRKKSEISTY